MSSSMILDILISAKHALTYFFIANYKIGQFIVSTSCLIVKTLYEVTEKLFCLLHIILEDFHLFAQDVLRGIVNVINIISSLLEDAFNVSLWIVDKVWCLLLNGISVSKLGTYNFFSSVSLFAEEMIILIVYFVELCGGGVWFLLTIVPLSLYYSLIYCYNLLKNIQSNIETFHKVLHTTYSVMYNIVTDVSVESVTGLVSIFFITYVITRFYILFVRLFRKSCRILYTSLTERFIISKFQMKTIWMQGVMKLFSKKTVNLEKKELNQLCIICQERIRCIVILPCRHLCLCRECNVVLRRYHTNCPICRQEIEHTMKVFL